MDQLRAIIEPVVYVVDDDEFICDIAKTLLQSVGFRVETYRTAEVFLESFRGDTPGCLLLDIRMPRMSGPQLQKELLKRNFDIPIIFMTGHADVATTVQVMRLGAANLLEKPFNGQSLIEEVSACVERSLENWKERDKRDDFVAQMRQLTERELQVARLVVRGISSKQIGRALKISNRTVDAHRRRIFAKFSVQSALELAQKFRDGGESDPA